MLTIWIYSRKEKEALQQSEFLIMWPPEMPIVNTFRESTGASNDTTPLRNHKRAILIRVLWSADANPQLFYTRPSAS